MTTKSPIRERVTKKATDYYPLGKMKSIRGLGTFPSRLLEIYQGYKDITNKFDLSTITNDFVYYVHETEPDTLDSVVMLDLELDFVSDNILAEVDLYDVLKRNLDIRWMSRNAKIWQKIEVTRPQLITPTIQRLLNKVDTESLNKEEKDIYNAFRFGGPVKYSHEESLMAVLANNSIPFSGNPALADVRKRLKRSKG